MMVIFLPWRLGKAFVVLFDVFGSKCIGLLNRANPRQAHGLHHSILKHPICALDTSLGLRSEGEGMENVELQLLYESILQGSIGSLDTPFCLRRFGTDNLNIEPATGS
ncbi:MAG: hypothetical protein BGP17_09715 [Sphingomonas sp. 67-41]|nr:MAG: hypothetical protein BGP17_09715 [Sphingomonas sp. 67-41]